MTELSQNNSLESQKQEVAPLEILRKEIADIKKAELEKKGKSGIYDPHLDDIEPADLSDDDLWLYQRLKNGVLTMSELKKIQGGFTYSQKDYRNYILGEVQTEKKPAIKYNSFFLRWIINKAMDMEYGKELKKSENGE